MNDFLQSVKSDLLSRRLLPFVALVGVALIAAAGYAAVGASKSSAPIASPSTPSSAATGSGGRLAVAVAPANPNEAASETPNGTHYQSHGSTRDPFTPLPSPPAAKSASASGAGSPAGTSKPSSGGSGSSNGGTGPGKPTSPAPTPAKPSKPSKPAKPPFPYIVSALFGVASSTPGQQATLVPYEKLAPSQSMPSKKDVRISFQRVTNSGNGAVFKLVVAPILNGPGICLPSASECKTIALMVGQTEQLEYVEADGQVVVYELKVVSIVKKSAIAASAKRRASAARAKRELLTRTGHTAGAALAGGKMPVAVRKLMRARARIRRGAHAARAKRK